MEREDTGTKYMAANCEESQRPPRAVKLRNYNKNYKTNSVVLVRKRTIPTERPQPAGEVSANFS
jgi:hypothetical protein